MNNEPSENRSNSSDINEEPKNVTPELSNSNQEQTPEIDQEIDTISNEMGNPGINEELETDSAESKQVASVEDVPTESLETNQESTVPKDGETDSSPDNQSPSSDAAQNSTIEHSDTEPVGVEEGNSAEDLSEVQEVTYPTDGEPDGNFADESSSSSLALKQTKAPSDKEQVIVLQEQVNQLQTEVERLQQQVVTKDGQIEQLTEEITTKDQKIGDLEEQINNPALIFLKKKLKQQETDLEQDQKELASYLEQTRKWSLRNQTLQEGINSAVAKSKVLLAQSREIKEKLPETLQSQIQKRQEGLELIGKMLGRLQTPANAPEESTESPQLPIASEPELIALLDTEATEELGQKAIAKKLQEVGTQRWQIISRVRDSAEKQRKNWLNTIDKKILPILDGINDGEKFSANLLEDWQQNYPGCATDLEAWFRTYSELGKILLETLESVKVYPMAVAIGKQIDYNRHEPFDVQPDANLQNEDIKEVTREGYEYEADQERLVLRSAQVMVVKND